MYCNRGFEVLTAVVMKSSTFLDIIKSQVTFQKNMLPPSSVQTSYGIHIVSYTMGIRDCSPGVKQLGHEDDYSPPLPHMSLWCVFR
jgi:hypothetical protein